MALAVLSLFSPARLAVSDPGDALSDADARSVVDGMWGTLSSVHTGAGTAVFTWAYTPESRRQADFEFVFDYDSGHARVDRRFADDNQPFIRIDSPEETIVYYAGSSIVDRKPPNSATSIEGEDPFDVRVLALIGFGDLTISNDDMTGLIWEQFRANLATYPPPRVTAAEGGRLAITWEKSFLADPPGGADHKYSLSKFTVFVDPREQFLPQRMEMFSGFGPAPQGIRGELYSVTETKWNVVDGVPVPVDCVYDIVGTTKHAELHLKWKAVNGPIDPRPFTIEGLDLPAGTMIINDRLGPSIVESIVGRPSMDASVPSGGGAWRWTLTGASIAALVAFFACIIFFKKTRSRHDR
ncbi:MAG: hypothetical protein ACREQE_11970 [Candidatus Binataceae bacterium]